MAGYASLIFFRTGRGDLDTAAAALSNCGMSVERVAREFGDELTAGFRSGPRLRIAFVNKPYVRQEAEEISEGKPHDADMRLCEARYEILIDDLDGVLDEINTLIDVQRSLQEATKGFLFNTWNGALLGPESKGAGGGKQEAGPPSPPDSATGPGK